MREKCLVSGMRNSFEPHVCSTPHPSALLAVRVLKIILVLVQPRLRVKAMLISHSVSSDESYVLATHKIHNTTTSGK